MIDSARAVCSRAIFLTTIAAISVPLGAQASTTPAWTVSAAPSLVIGDESDPNKQFQRVGAVGRFSDGSIVVANRATQELRVFSADGQFLRSLSRKGSGPGEMQALNTFFISNDTLMAIESQPGASSIHYFTPKGFISRTVINSTGGTGTSAIDRFSDGRLLVAPGFRVGPELPSGTIYDDTLRLGVRAPVTDEAPHWIGSFPSVQILLIPSPYLPGRPAPVQYSFGRYLGRAISGDRLWVGDSQTGIVTQYDSFGKRLGEFKVPISARPFRADAIARAKAADLEDAPNKNGRDRIEALYAAPRPANVPLFTSFVAGAGGEIWIRLYEEEARAPSSYVVLDRSGRSIGRVTLPANFTLYEVALDNVLGILRDDDGVERIASYRIGRR